MARWTNTAWSAARPERAYLLSDDVAPVSAGGNTVLERQTLELVTIDLAADAEPHVSSPTRFLLSRDGKFASSSWTLVWPRTDSAAFRAPGRGAC